MVASCSLHASNLLPIGSLRIKHQHIVIVVIVAIIVSSTCHDDSVWQRNSTKTTATTWKRLLKIPSLTSFNQSFSGGKVRTTNATSDQKNPLHIIIVKVATTMVPSPLIQLREIFHPSAGCILAHCYRTLSSPSQNDHLRHLNGTST